MNIEYDFNSYKELQKEVLYNMNILKQTSELICTPDYVNDKNLQKNSVSYALQITGQLVNILSKMDFVISNGEYKQNEPKMEEGIVNEEGNNMVGDNDSSISGDANQLCETVQDNNEILEEN